MTSDVQFERQESQQVHQQMNLVEVVEGQTKKKKKEDPAVEDNNPDETHNTNNEY